MYVEVSNYLQQFDDAGKWQVMMHFFIDVEGLLARCANNDIRLKDGEMRDFMLGFTQAQPLFMIVDVGHDPGRLSRKVEGTSDCCRYSGSQPCFSHDLWACRLYHTSCMGPKTIH